MSHIRCQGCRAKDHFIDLLESAECLGDGGLALLPRLRKRP